MAQLRTWRRLVEEGEGYACVDGWSQECALTTRAGKAGVRVSVTVFNMVDPPYASFHLSPPLFPPTTTVSGLHVAAVGSRDP